MMIITKQSNLNEILSNGISSGTITDIFGFRGTGKTQMSLQISLNILKKGKNVLFIDTTNEFRPERLLDIIKNRDLDDSLLDNLNIDNIFLIVVDNIADLFSFEFSKKEQFNFQQQKFMNYMHDLSQLAIYKKIPVIITNQLMKANDVEYERMNYSISHYTHQKIKLEKKKNHYEGIVLSPYSQKIRFFYKIEKMGLVEGS